MLKETNKAIPIKIEHPTFFFTVPSTKKEVKLRGYTVKEEKMLLVGIESKDWKELLNAFKQVISNCSFGEIDPDTLSTYDIEAFFIALKGRSSGDIVSIPLKKTHCPLKGGAYECDKPSTIKVNLSQVKLTVIEKGEVVPLELTTVRSDLQILLSDNVGIKMRHPRFSDMEIAKNIVKEDDPDFDDLGVELMARCITDFFDKESVYPASEYSMEDKIDFLNDLDKETMKKIDVFFKSIPKIRHKCEFICAHCDVREEYKIEGLSDFFV